MRIMVLYFGLLRERFGLADEAVEIADGADVRGLLDILRSRTSNQAMTSVQNSDLDERMWRSLAVAVNREYSSLDAVLRDGDEVALLPPVSGGAFADSERLVSLAGTSTQGPVR